MTVAVFLDMFGAYDQREHAPLLWAPLNIGISGMTLIWISNYFQPHSLVALKNPGLLEVYLKEGY